MLGLFQVLAASPRSEHLPPGLSEHLPPGLSEHLPPGLSKHLPPGLSDLPLPPSPPRSDSLWAPLNQGDNDCPPSDSEAAQNTPRYHDNDTAADGDGDRDTIADAADTDCIVANNNDINVAITNGALTTTTNNKDDDESSTKADVVPPQPCAEDTTMADNKLKEDRAAVDDATLQHQGLDCLTSSTDSSGDVIAPKIYDDLYEDSTGTITRKKVGGRGWQ